MTLAFRPPFQRFIPPVIAVLSALVLSACNATTPARVHQSETFTLETPFQYYSSRLPEAACEIGKRALLSQGYQVDSTVALNIRGEKYFRPTTEQATKLTITLVCLPSSLGAAIYANALETNFELKSRGSSAGLSVSGFGSLSMPWAMDKDTLVKVGEATITEPAFYQRLFDLIKTLDG